MRTFRLTGLWRLRKSYWFLPSVLTLGALVLGFLLPWIDARLGAGWMAVVPFLQPTGVDGARALLTMLAGAILGVAGVAFSITMVAVSFASANYGPRLIGNFMADRVNQTVLGVFVATFVYCTTVLATVHASPGDPATFVPQISVLVSLALALASIGALIVYIHHIPESIDIMNLTAGIGEKLRRSVASMLEEEDARQAKREGVLDVAPVSPAGAGAHTALGAPAAGYIQHIDVEAVREIALERGVQVVVVAAPGDFVAAGEPVLRVRSAEPLPDAARRALVDALAVGSARTDVQDVLFLSDQLVEVMGRALSPGINDPYTAIICLDWLRAGMSAFASRPPVPPPASDAPVIFTRVTFEEMANRSFGRARQYVSGDRTVTLHMLHVLASLARVASNEARAAFLVRHMRTLAASAGDRLQEEAARREVHERLDHLLRGVAARWGEAFATPPADAAA